MSDILVQTQKKKYQSSFIRENKIQGEGSGLNVYQAGQSFQRSYTLLNDGDHVWPETVVFAQRPVNGTPDLQAQVTTVDPALTSIVPQQECTFTVTCVAPQKEGICCAEFGLQTEDGEKFGCVIQCYISVPKLEEDKQAEESLLLANREKTAATRQRSRSRSPAAAA